MMEVGMDPDSAKDVWDVATMKDQGLSTGQMKVYFDVKALYDSKCYSLKGLFGSGLFSLDELVKTGADAAALKNVGCDAQRLHKAGFDAKALKEAGFAAMPDLYDLGITQKELRELGFGAMECSLKIKEIKEKGYSGLTEEERSFLDKGGFNAAVVDPKDLVDAGFDAVSLKDAGFDLWMLKRAGMSIKSLEEAYTLPVLVREKFPCEELKEAGFMLADLKQAYADVYSERHFPHTVLLGEAVKLLRDGIYKPQDFREAGFTALDLQKDGGFSAKEIYQAGFPAEELFKVDKGSNVPIFNFDALSAAGYKADHIDQLKYKCN